MWKTGLLALGLVAVSFSLASQEYDKDEQVRIAKKTMEDFFVDFNAADNEALQEHMNYPHIFLTGNGRARMQEERMDMNFDAMREREGWAKSTLDSVEPSMVFDGKVHFNLVFSRVGTDGKVYRTVPGQWIVTRQDGHWGVQVRSY